MTHDEHRKAFFWYWLRAKCIEAIALVLEDDLRDIVDPGSNTFMYGGDRSHWIDAATLAFDALRSAGVRVVPMEATEDMLEAAWESIIAEDGKEAWKDMSAAGDLTNPPEQKP